MINITIMLLYKPHYHNPVKVSLAAFSYLKYFLTYVILRPYIFHVNERFTSTGFPAKSHGFFMNLCHFYPIFYAILYHSLMEFMLFHDTFSSISSCSMLANCYSIFILLYYHLNMNMRIKNIIYL